MREDADKFGSQSRFGYFSIAHSAFLGDGFYSEKKYKVRKEQKNVITEPRGIFSNPGRKGQGIDVFFSNDFKTNDETVKRLEDIARKEQEDYISKVKKSKSKEGKDFKSSFKPGGPQLYNDFFDSNRKMYDVPITKEIDKKAKIDKKGKTVVTERRGIYTNPPRQGTSTTPGIFFKDYVTDDELLKRQEKISEEENKLKRKDEKKDDRLGFKPASLKRNEAFQKDAEIYGEGDQIMGQLLDIAIEVRIFLR